MRVHLRRRGRQLVALGRGQRVLERRERRRELLGTARADHDRHARVAEEPGERERRRVAAALELLERVEDGVGAEVLVRAAAQRHARASGGASSRRYFPVSQPPASGLNAWNQTRARAQSGSTSCLDLAVEQRVRVLHRRERTRGERLAQLARRRHCSAP